MSLDPLASDEKVPTSLRLKRRALDAVDQLVDELNNDGMSTSRTELVEAWMAIGLPDQSAAAELVRDYRRWRAGGALSE